MAFKTTKILILFFISQLFFVLTAEAKFVLYEPKNKPTTPAPLFVVVHGFSSSAQDIATVTHFTESAEREGFYVLYPESEDPNIWVKCWQYFLPEQQVAGQGEAHLIIQEIQKIKNQYPINPNKIYLAGMSAGASLASILTSCYPDMFQAVAFHSGTSYGLSSTWKEALIDLKTGPSFTRTANTACHPKDYKGKVIIFHGSKDDLVNIKHFDRYVSDFLADTKVESKNVPENATRFPYEQKSFFKDGKQRGQGYIVDGMIHTWSGGTTDGKDKDNNPTKMGPDATELILNFFLYEK